MLKYYSLFEYNTALIPAKKLISLDKQIHDTNTRYAELYEYLADYLFMAKILIKLDKIKSTRECLLIIQNIINNLFDEQHLLKKKDGILLIRGEYTPELLQNLQQVPVVTADNAIKSTV